jgi:hypothetical protein
MHVFAQPTTLHAGVQRLLGRMAAGAGYALEIADGRLRLTVGDGSRTAQVESDVALSAHCWYSLGATYDPATGEAAIYQAPMRNPYNSLLSWSLCSATTCAAGGRTADRRLSRSRPTRPPAAITAS